MFDGTPADLPGTWPQFRGANGDAIGQVDVTLSRNWPAEGPPALWSVDLGEGYAGAVVRDGRVYVVDYDQEKHGDLTESRAVSGSCRRGMGQGWFGMNWIHDIFVKI